MRRIWLTCGCLLLGCSIASSAEVKQGRDLFDWAGHEAGEAAKGLPVLPKALGAAGAFAGVSNGALIVAGGHKPPAANAKGEWSRAVCVLERSGDKTYTWHETGVTLDGPSAFGASVTTRRGVVLIGGQDATQCYRTVVRLVWDKRAKTLSKETLPDLPEPCGGPAAALIGHTLYVAGGLRAPDAKHAMTNFWALDTSKGGDELQWQTLPWIQIEQTEHGKVTVDKPPGLAFCSAVAQNNGKHKDPVLYLIGGYEVAAVAGRREVLSSARCFAYDPKARGDTGRWQEIPHFPGGAAVASPAVPYGPYHVLVFGRSETSKVDRRAQTKPRPHPWSRRICAYHTVSNTWASYGEMPEGHAHFAAVLWGDDVVLLSEDVRSRTRAPKLLLGEAKKRAPAFGSLNYGILIGYLGILVLMGIYFSRREKTTEDFFLAGRRVPWWAAGLSIYGTQLSAITFIAIPAAVYARNWVPYLAQICIVLIAPLVVFCYLPFFRRLQVTTAYEYLEVRFNLVVRLMSSILFILFQIGRMSIVMLLPAIALSAATGLNLYLCIAVMGILCTIYTVLGGIEAVVWTDVLQVFVLLGGAIVSLFVIAGNVDGGFIGIARMAKHSNKIHMFNWGWSCLTMTVWVVVIGNLFANLVPYTTDQAVIQRYLTTKSERHAARSIWTNALLVIPGSLLFFAIGTALFVFFKTQPQQLDPGLPADGVFPLFIVDHLYPGIAGLVIAGIFAASMSSLDSSLNSVSTAVVTDFYSRFHEDADDRKCLALARWVTVVLGVVATLAALYLGSFGTSIRSLWFHFNKILGLTGGALAGIFALAIFTRRASAAGAIAGAVAGTVVTLTLWISEGLGRPLLHFYLWAGAGTVTCFVVGYVVSLFVGEKKDLRALTLYTMPPRTD